MEKTYKERLKRSFGKTLLDDSPVPNRKIKFFPSGNKLKPLKSKLIKLLPEPLKPTKYVPIATLRTQKSRVPPPVPLPRYSTIPEQIDEEVENVIDLITPLYKPEATLKFQKNLSDKKLLREIVKENDRALKKQCQIIPGSHHFERRPSQTIILHYK